MEIDALTLSFDIAGRTGVLPAHAVLAILIDDFALLAEGAEAVGGVEGVPFKDNTTLTDMSRKGCVIPHHARLPLVMWAISRNLALSFSNMSVRFHVTLDREGE